MKLKYTMNMDTGLRMILAALAVIGQIILFIWLTNTLHQSGTYLYTLVQAIGLLTILRLINRQESPSYKISWLLVVFFVPVFGLLLYFLWGRANHRRFRKMREREIANSLWDPDNLAPDRLAAFEKVVPERVRIARYLHHHHFPLYEEETSSFYALGEACFDALCADLEEAKSFIFLEFFIVGDGRLWERVSSILRRKAREGVTVRFLMDDFGGMRLTHSERVLLRNSGVEARSFNPILKHVSNLYLNYRNHQKIVAIDGHIGYTGGVNLADEYVNLRRKHGHWKDTAVRVTGAGVWSLTLAFLKMWDFGARNPREDYLKWRVPATVNRNSFTEDESAGYIQPFTDGPANNPHNPAKAVCHQMIETANNYVWITTPYLILEDDMLESLARAAESGVDVRIITPSVPDKWYVHLVTRSHYGRLIAAGVRIFEYTPGFMHAKMIVSDDDHAMVGTVNFDFRSFYLQFENAIWFCNSPVVGQVRQDYLNTLARCKEMTYQEWLDRPMLQKFAATGFRLFSTLM